MTTFPRPPFRTDHLNQNNHRSARASSSDGRYSRAPHNREGRGSRSQTRNFTSDSPSVPRSESESDPLVRELNGAIEQGSIQSLVEVWNRALEKDNTHQNPQLGQAQNELRSQLQHGTVMDRLVQHLITTSQGRGEMMREHSPVHLLLSKFLYCFPYFARSLNTEDSEETPKLTLEAKMLRRVQSDLLSFKLPGYSSSSRDKCEMGLLREAVSTFHTLLARKRIVMQSLANVKQENVRNALLDLNQGTVYSLRHAWQDVRKITKALLESFTERLHLMLISIPPSKLDSEAYQTYLQETCAVALALSSSGTAAVKAFTASYEAHAWDSRESGDSLVDEVEMRSVLECFFCALDEVEHAILTTSEYPKNKEDSENPRILPPAARPSPSRRLNNHPESLVGHLRSRGHQRRKTSPDELLNLQLTPVLDASSALSRRMNEPSKPGILSGVESPNGKSAMHPGQESTVRRVGRDNRTLQQQLADNDSAEDCPIRRDTKGHIRSQSVEDILSAGPSASGRLH